MTSFSMNPSDFPGFDFATCIMKTLVLALVIALGFSGSAQSVEIPDPELQKAIRSALGKPKGNITGADMESLTELNASRWSRFRSNSIQDIQPIQNLEGLDAAVNLISLNLSGIPIPDPGWFAVPGSPILLGPGFGPNLAVEDFGALAGLSSLRRLNLEGNDLVSFSVTPTLTNLEELNLHGNWLIEVILPEGLSSLTSLDLSGNQLTAVSFLEPLTSLNVLALGDNELTSLTLPEGLTRLRSLDLRANQLTTLTLTEGMTRLRELDLTGNSIATLEAPGGVDIERLQLTGFDKSKITFCKPIKIELLADSVQISWTREPGVLQSSDAVGGKWSDIPDATSPYQVEATDSQRFFRVKSE